MRKRLGDLGALFAVIGIPLMIIGAFFNYFPVPETHVVKYVDNDHDGVLETPITETNYVFPYAAPGAYAFIIGLVLSLIGGLFIIKSEKDPKLPKNGHILGRKYSERMPPPYFWGKT
jgi:hypothetical protein